MRTHSISNNAGSLAIIALLGIAGFAYAQQPSPGVATQPAEPTATPTAPSATSTPATSPATTAPAGQQTNNGHPSPEVIKAANREGYTMKTKSGNYFFCKENTDVGTRFATEHCVDADALALTLERQQMDRDALKNSRTTSSGK
ncbi:MAG TPA: hypothetical protein VIH50_07590 [Steroidobacteraceae bacterium]|jgi:hypothetical protein